MGDTAFENGMRHLSIVSVLPIVDDGRHASSLEKQTGVPAWKQSNVLRKPPDSIEKNSNFTSQNTGVSGLPLLQSVSLFVLLCDFGESELTKSHTIIQHKLTD